MKQFNKKKMFIALGEFLLATAGLTTSVLAKSRDIKFIMVSLVCLLISLHSGRRAFSERKIDETLDERDKIIALKVNDRMLKIFSTIIILFLIAGMSAYTITDNLNIIIALLPVMIMVVIAGFLYIILYLYYEKRM